MDVDHVFAFVSDPVTALRAMRTAGLVATHARRHHHQGTENSCYGFDNAYIELIWCVDRREITSEAVAPTGLDGRSRWAERGTCPYGVCLRSANPPVPTWKYSVPFPPGMHADMAATSARAEEPAVFFFPGGPPPPPGRQPLGARITEFALAFDVPADPSPALELLRSTPHVAIHQARKPHLTVTLDGGTSRRIEIPEVPLTIQL